LDALPESITEGATHQLLPLLLYIYIYIYIYSSLHC
jgi:hypothetical protein